MNLLKGTTIDILLGFQGGCSGITPVGGRYKSLHPFPLVGEFWKSFSLELLLKWMLTWMASTENLPLGWSASLRLWELCKWLHPFQDLQDYMPKKKMTLKKPVPVLVHLETWMARKGQGFFMVSQAGPVKVITWKNLSLPAWDLSIKTLAPQLLKFFHVSTKFIFWCVSQTRTNVGPVQLISLQGVLFDCLAYWVSGTARDC